MKTHWLVDILMYILGACFNGFLLMLLVITVLTQTQKGYMLGVNYAKEMTTERESHEIEFVLEEDTGRVEVARMLEEQGIIGNQHLFVLELILKNSSKSYRAGTYILDPSMTNTTVNWTLRKQPETVIEHDIITIREGWSIRDIAVYLADRDLMTEEEFIQACEDFDSYFSFLNDVPKRANRLEGYLFPDTYYITQFTTANDIIYRMLERFDAVFTDEYRRRAEELGMTLDEIVIIASMIEKEVRVAEERPIVAQVIYNRLKKPMRLQIDATVLYALNISRDRLFLSDYEVESPYSTYTNDGLPVGPISNPGVNCIHAALYPEEGNYFYYVVSNIETGEHHFSRTLDEHNQAAARYHQMLGD